MNFLNICTLSLALVIVSSSALTLTKVENGNSPRGIVDFLPCDDPPTGLGVILLVDAECEGIACPFDPSEQYDMSIIFTATETSNALKFRVDMYAEAPYQNTSLAYDTIPGFVIEGSAYNVSHVIEMDDLPGANGIMVIQLWDESRGHAAACARIIAAFSGQPTALPTTTIATTETPPTTTLPPPPPSTEAPSTPVISPITDDSSLPTPIPFKKH